MKPNIGKLYTVRKHFSSRIQRQDCFIKIRPSLARIILQRFDCTKKHVNFLVTFTGQNDNCWKELGIRIPKMPTLTKEDERTTKYG